MNYELWSRRSRVGQCAEVVVSRRGAARRRSVTRCTNPAKHRVRNGGLGVDLLMCGVHVLGYEPQSGNSGGWEFTRLAKPFTPEWEREVAR